MRCVAPAILLTMAAAVGRADTGTPPRVWQGVIDAGYISSMGTSSGSKETFHGKVAVTHNGPYWINIMSAEGVSVRDEISQTDDPERYLASYKARHFYDEHNFFTFRAQWEKDQVSLYEYQVFSSLGLGRELLKSDAQNLKIEAGPVVRVNQVRHGEDQNEGIGLFSWDYTCQVSPSSRLFQKASIESGASGTVTRINTQFRQSITQVLALTLTHDYKHENADNNTREGIFSIGLSYQL